MFVGKLVNRYSGVSKKNGKPFYTIDLSVDQDNGMRVMFKTFVSEDIFNKVSTLPLDSNVTVISGVNGFGNLCVTDIRTK